MRLDSRQNGARALPELRRLQLGPCLLVASFLVATSLVGAGLQPPALTYYPPRGEWRKQAPAEVGVDAKRLEEAIAFAIANENPDSKDLAVTIPNQFRNETPYTTLIGPTQPRAGANGLVIRHGSVIAEWGDTSRADMTFERHKDLPLDGGWCRIRSGADSQCFRPGRAVHAEGCGSLQLATQRAHHLGAPAAPDERLVGNTMGKA